MIFKIPLAVCRNIFIVGFVPDNQGTSSSSPRVEADMTGTSVKVMQVFLTTAAPLQ
jgi:hypothetical protein